MPDDPRCAYVAARRPLRLAGDVVSRGPGATTGTASRAGEPATGADLGDRLALIQELPGIGTDGSGSYGLTLAEFQLGVLVAVSSGRGLSRAVQRSAVQSRVRQGHLQPNVELGAAVGP